MPADVLSPQVGGGGRTEGSAQGPAEGSSEGRTEGRTDGRAGGRRTGGSAARARTRALLHALEHLVGGLGTAVLALATLLALTAVAALCLIGVGLLLVPYALRLLRRVADRERARLSRWGPAIPEAGPAPHRARTAVHDPAVRRELGWLFAHGTLGLTLGALGLGLPVHGVRDVTFPLWWPLVPADQASAQLPLWHVGDLRAALWVSALGLLWAGLFVALGAAMARLQAWPGRTLLAPDPGTDLALRVARLTATRAAALDAHAAELRRLERSLHDGTQNRLVAVTVLLGAARRAVARDDGTADALLDRAQDAAEQSLAELRAVVRTILPPVLAERSLADALTGLAASSPVPCRIDADLPPGRCAAATVEATAYFTVAEALTNVAKHSGAAHAAVRLRRTGDLLTVEVTDDGRGGAAEDGGAAEGSGGDGDGGGDGGGGGDRGAARGGTGLGGIRRRAEAHDGTVELASPPGGPTTLKVTLPCGL